MAKVRLEITKGEEIRYLSHLDYARTIERALRRSKLPVAYSEGFNPHMKVAYASALGVGVASDAEYMDLELSGDLPLAEIEQRFACQLPPGIVLKRLKFMGDRTQALMAIVNQAVYEVTVPLADGADDSAFFASLNRFAAAQQVIYVKESPKGRREIDVKQLLAAPIQATVADKTATLHVVIHITKTGSVKASEVLSALADSFGLPVKKDSANINRTALYIADNKTQLTPMEIL